MENSFFALFVFLFGLIVGSFLNAVVYRIEKGESFVKGRSFCPNCRHQLSPFDLVPLLSFFALKGRCRYCRKEISWQYPLVELATALLFILIFNLDLQPGILIYYLIASCFLIIIFVYDLKYYIIPDGVIFPAITLSLAYNVSLFLAGGGQLAVGNVFAGTAAAAFFLIIVLISKGDWMGIGDIKLALFMGLFLGWPKILIALFFAFVIGAAIGLILIALKRKGLKSEIPFAPFLITGTFIAVFFGNYLINLYYF